MVVRTDLAVPTRRPALLTESLRDAVLGNGGFRDTHSDLVKEAYKRRTERITPEERDHIAKKSSSKKIRTDVIRLYTELRTTGNIREPAESL
jgi:hypothetical protein